MNPLSAVVSTWGKSVTRAEAPAHGELRFVSELIEKLSGGRGGGARPQRNAATSPVTDLVFPGVAGSVHGRTGNPGNCASLSR